MLQCRQSVWRECCMSWLWWCPPRCWWGWWCQWRWHQTQHTLETWQCWQYSRRLSGLTVIVCVGSTDARGVLPRFSSRSKGVSAGASVGGGGEARECLEVQSELADIIWGFVDGELTCSSAGGGVGAGVVGVPDVGGVGGDAGATWGGGNHTCQ